jgi:ribonuclease-3
VEPKLKQLEQKLNIHFKQPELLELALIHPSYLSEHPEVKEHNQRLAFVSRELEQFADPRVKK